MFVGWEGVGLCSYLLIGFWYKETANADAGKKAFITNRVGDFGFLIGMFLVYQYTGTLKFTEIDQATRGAGLLTHLWLGAPVAFWASLFLFVGATGKSAQIPLYVWLPDAMAGPTPVSALIHAATMVTAGVYMVARMHLLYLLSPGAMAIVAGIGALTALFAAIIGFAQNDFKKVLAYSTVSQLGFMFAGVGTGNFDGGVFHLYTHAFFKAGLFLCAGSVMHAMSGSGDITIMGGLRKKVPLTWAVFFVCWLAICGVPGLSGFFSKDSIVGGAFGTPIFKGDLAWVGPAVGTVLLIAALGTAFYMSRLYFLVFTGETRASEEIKHHIHESPPLMVGPLIVLAAGALVGGAVIFPGALFGHEEWNLLAHRLEPVLGHELEVPHSTEAVFMIVSSLIAFAGIGAAWLFYGGGYREPAKKFAATFPGLVRLVRDKFRIDELYNALFVRPIKRAGGLIFSVVDRILIDTVMVEGTAKLTGFLGSFARRFQRGDGQGYMAWFAIGVAALVYFTTRPALSGDLVVTKTGLDVTVDARHGGKTAQQPLEYEFDFDDDGKPEVTGTSSQAHYTYARPGSYKLRITVKNPAWGRKSSETTQIEVP
jgi:NADH-quinone oxidoreductase subunit L